MSAPPMSVRSSQPRPAPPARSLWRELSDGSAGWVVRLILTIALGAMLSAACLIGSYLLAAMFPSMFDRYYSSRANNPGGSSSGARPHDELVAWLFVLSGLFYLAAIAWVWSPVFKRRVALWYAAIATILIAAITLAVAVLAEAVLTGDDELVLSGIGFLGGGAVLLVWLEVWRRYGRGRAVANEQDGLPDVRCPTCGYRMVGLYESRCPECGTAYTLEDLLGRQEFQAARAKSGRAAEHADRLPPVPGS